MLNRNQRAVPAPWAALERRRAGERLRAALAGLQELEHLRERQRELVKRALGTDPAPDQSGAEEQRLEATLSALKEQLVRISRGLKYPSQISTCTNPIVNQNLKEVNSGDWYSSLFSRES